MQIKPLTVSAYSTYSDLVTKFGGSVFNFPQWLAIYNANNLCPFGIFNHNNELIGSFVLYKSSKFGLPFYCNPPFMPHIGLFFENRALNKSNYTTFAKNVMQLLVEHFNKLPYKLLTVALPAGNIDTQPFIWNNYKVIPGYTYRLNLQITEEELFNNMTSERRKSIKKAIKDDLTITPVSDYKLVKLLVLKTFNRKHKALNTKLLDKILFEFANTSNSFAFIAFKGSQPIAATFCIYDAETVYYLMGGYDETEKHHGAGPSCMWQSILHAKKMGLKVFDFEGSMLSEVERYFREFGGEITPYYTVNKAWLPLEIGLKFIKRSQF